MKLLYCFSLLAIITTISVSCGTSPVSSKDSAQVTTDYYSDEYDETENFTDKQTEYMSEVGFDENTVKNELPVLVGTHEKPHTVKEFFEKSIFIGDSIMLGFSRYLTKNTPADFVTDDQVYGIGSYSVYHAINPTNNDAVGPVLQGSIISPENLCAELNANYVYILLGINDIALIGVDQTFENYKLLISRIRQKNPDIRICVISVPYILEGAEKTKLNNTNIHSLNTLLENYCKTTLMADYINIADPLSKDGFLNPDYCSDGFIHQNTNAYEVWHTVLQQYASDKIEVKDPTSASETITETTFTQTTTLQTTTAAPVKMNVTDYYSDSVFVGDSITVGFSNYLRNKKNDLYGKPQFIAKVSMGACHALMPIDKTDLHPNYNGVKTRIPDAVKKCGAKKVFLSLGINDLASHEINTSYNDYIQLINEIIRKNPDIKLYIISTTNICDGAETGTLTNNNVRELNRRISSFCKQNKITYIDIASSLVNKNGALSRNLSSDNYVHQNDNAYKIWVKKLNEFAKTQQ